MTNICITIDIIRL